MHAAHYSRRWGFGQFLESTVARGGAEFTGRLDHPRNQAWAAIRDGRIVGSIAIDGEDLGDNQAHLRWFILDEGCRGGGRGPPPAGRGGGLLRSGRLRRHPTLDIERPRHGAPGTQWSAEVIEQPFSRRGPG